MHLHGAKCWILTDKKNFQDNCVEDRECFREMKTIHEDLEMHTAMALGDPPNNYKNG